MADGSKTLIILPHQLFDVKYFPGTFTSANTKVVLWEHPQYFTKYNFNKKKLLLHRASMKYYQQYLKDLHFSVKYIPFYSSVKFTNGKNFIFDPIDKINLGPDAESIVKIESPNFLLTKPNYETYRNKTKKTRGVQFNAFYKFGKKIVDIIPLVKSQDKDNRKRMPDHVVVPPLPTQDSTLSPRRRGSKYIASAKTYVKKHFPNNHGTLPKKAEEFLFPITHSDAIKWLEHFIEKKFEKFGDYQDFIDKDNEYLFHSVLSSSMNCGLINPQDVVNRLRGKLEKKIPMNSFEGYVRQLFWREYQRYCYIYYGDELESSKYFPSGTRSVSNWYPDRGCLGIPPVDNAIKQGFETGYLNHISRLMVVGNFMNLSGIAPKEGFKWFMEFSCDSYEWVMYQNVYDMVFFVTGGATMRRPYISSSNYIIKMSNFPKGDWTDTWDNLYKDFIKKNKKELHKFRYYYRLKKE